MAAGRSRPHRVSLPPVAELLCPAAPGPSGETGRQAAGRGPYPHKITLHLPARVLFDLERARLARRGYGVTVDRGTLAREEIAGLLADPAPGGGASPAARRLGSAAGPGPAGSP